MGEIDMTTINEIIQEHKCFEYGCEHNSLRVKINEFLRREIDNFFVFNDKFINPRMIVVQKEVEELKTRLGLGDGA